VKFPDGVKPAMTVTDLMTCPCAAATTHWLQGTEEPSRPAKLCQKDLHDLEREEAEQTASKKRRSEISSFSIAANLSCDDLSRAGSEAEGEEHPG